MGLILFQVDWVEQARWVKDGNIYTSAGVSAGIDASLALVQEIWGQAAANDIASKMEYGGNFTDPSLDPFVHLIPPKSE